MPKICFVRPIYNSSVIVDIPLNLLILASTVSEYNAEIVIKDYHFMKEFNTYWNDWENFAMKSAKDIIDTNCKYICITSMNSNYVLANELASAIKVMDSSLIIIFGGPQASLSINESLNTNESIDFIVYGEGELSFPSLINTLECGGNPYDLQGVAFKKGNTIFLNKRPLIHDMDCSPFPAFNLIKLDKYVELFPTVSILIGQGCPYECSFCSTSIMWERKYRTKSVSRIIQEIEYLVLTHNIFNFTFIHDNLTVNNNFFFDLITAINMMKHRIVFSFSSRIDTISSEHFALLASAGCRSIFFGVEHISSKIQDSIGKKLKLTDIDNVVKTCIEHRITPELSFIVGFPDEYNEDFDENLKYAIKNKVNLPRSVYVNALSIYSGSYLFESYKDSLIRNNDVVKLNLPGHFSNKQKKDIKNNLILYPNFVNAFLFFGKDTYTDKIFYLYKAYMEHYVHTFNFLINKKLVKLQHLYEILCEDLYEGKIDIDESSSFSLSISQIESIVIYLDFNEESRNELIHYYIHDTLLLWKPECLDELKHPSLFKSDELIAYKPNVCIECIFTDSSDNEKNYIFCLTDDTPIVYETDNLCLSRIVSIMSSNDIIEKESLLKELKEDKTH